MDKTGNMPKITGSVGMAEMSKANIPSDPPLQEDRIERVFRLRFLSKIAHFLLLICRTTGFFQLSTFEQDLLPNKMVGAPFEKRNTQVMLVIFYLRFSNGKGPFCGSECQGCRFHQAQTFQHPHSIRKTLPLGISTRLRIFGICLDAKLAKVHLLNSDVINRSRIYLQYINTYRYIVYVCTVYICSILAIIVAKIARLQQVGPDYTQELLESAGVLRFPWRNEEALLQHYVGKDAELWLICRKRDWEKDSQVDQEASRMSFSQFMTYTCWIHLLLTEESLLSRYGEKLLISAPWQRMCHGKVHSNSIQQLEVLPAARWVSSWLRFRLVSAKDELVLEAAGVGTAVKALELQSFGSRIWWFWWGSHMS